MGSSLEPAPPPSETRVVFISNLRDVDGYKLSTVHLARHLPDHIRASVLDVSCEGNTTRIPGADFAGNVRHPYAMLMF